MEEDKDHDRQEPEDREPQDYKEPEIQGDQPDQEDDLEERAEARSNPVQPTRGASQQQAHFLCSGTGMLEQALAYSKFEKVY